MPNVIGMAGLVAGLNALGSIGENSKSIREGHRRAATVIWKRVKAEAPQGPTGNLKRGVQSGTFKFRAGQPSESFVQMSSKIAPHAVLVEFGARGGRMPANPFFRRGVQSSAQEAFDAMVSGVGQAVDEAVK